MSKTKTPVRIGIVGCGVVATGYYLPYLLDFEQAEITAVCDLDPKRTAACVRLFGAKQQYTDYFEMLDKADLDAVFILTAPGTHAKFALAAIEHGLHLIIQKPMALNMDDANQITDAVRAKGVKCIVEPSSNTLLNENIKHLRELIDAGVLGKPYWFAAMPTAGTEYSSMLGGNPYGNKAFFSDDSGGMLFDFPYLPNKIVALLGDCKSVTGNADISVPERYIVPDHGYTEFLEQATDPRDCNYWDKVMHMEKTEKITMGAPDNVFSNYEMDSGWIGTFHIGRPFHPMLKGTAPSNFMVLGEGGNLIDGGGYAASIISSRKDLLPEVSDDGWYHIPLPYNPKKVQWPKPAGGYGYYGASTAHLIECIQNDTDPVPNVEFGRHITEMMYGALESAKTGNRYEMTTTTTGLRDTAATGATA
ncbi:MAG: Gfo/Idh/MocA family oxidoreductase [Phycisphaeraceae bacterium]